MAIPATMEEFLARNNILQDRLNQKRGSDMGLLLTEMVDLTEYVRVNLAPVVPANRVVIVNSMADFPAPVNGVITLEGYKQYLVGDNFNIGTNRLVMGPFTVLKGVDIDSARVNYLGTGTMITSVDNTFLIDNITLKCDDGQLFDVQDSVGSFTRLINVDVGDASNLGTFQSSAGAILLCEGLIATSITDGIDFIGTFNILQFSLASNVQFSGTFLDLGTATFNSIGLNEVSVFLASPTAKFLSGLPNSGNINVGGLARVTNCVINNLGGGTILDNITSDDTRWRFLNNQSIRDTRPDALMAMHGNVLSTVIGVIDTPVKVNAVWTAERSSQFEIDTSGRMTFVGDVPTTLPIGFNYTAQMLSGTNNTLVFYVAINGSIVTSAQGTIDPSATKPASGTVLWQHTFNKNDYVELFVANSEAVTDVIVTSAAGRIN